MRRMIKLQLVGIVWVVMALVDFGRCENRHWVDGSGDWTDPAHWSTTADGEGGAGVPTSADAAYVIHAGSSDLALSYQGDNACVSLDVSASDVGLVVVTQAVGELTVPGIVKLGEIADGHAKWIQTGGTNYFSDAYLSFFRIGGAADAMGTYVLMDGGLSCKGDVGGRRDGFRLGDNGTGLFIQHGGEHRGNTQWGTVCGDINAVIGGGWGPGTQYGGADGGHGTYIMHGGILAYADLGVGCTGEGYFYQYGGTNQANTLYMGTGYNGLGEYGLYDGVLKSTYAYTGLYGTGVFNQAGGTVLATPILGRYADAVGIYNMTSGFVDGDHPLNYSFVIGHEGRGEFNQAGGTFVDSTGNSSVGILGNKSGSFGVYNLGGGTGQFYSVYVGLQGAGIVNQTGGVLTVHDGSSGWEHTFPGGTSDAYSLVVGADTNGSGAYNLGDADATGLIANRSTSPTYAGHLIVRHVAGSEGCFRGWGKVKLGGRLANNGIVIADGYGTDRTLDLSFFSSVANTIENGGTETNGWYARGCGRIELPSIAVAVGNNNYNWGESPDDSVIDLVNSVRLGFDAVSKGDSMQIALMALDRTDLPDLPDREFFSAWSLVHGGNLTFDHVDLTFRYDHAALAASGVVEPVVYRHVSGHWLRQDGTLDETNCRITVTVGSLSGSDWFVVGEPMPAGSVIVLR